MFASQHGPGHLLKHAFGLYNAGVIMAATFLALVFAALVYRILLAVDRRLHFRAWTRAPGTLLASPLPIEPLGRLRGRCGRRPRRTE